MASKHLWTTCVFLVVYLTSCNFVRGQPLASVLSVLPTSSCFASRSTWYADNQHGACSYGPSLGATGNGNMYVAASSQLVWADSSDCGACYELTGPKGIVIVTVVDQCTDGGVCNTTFPHIDISPESFDVIADRTIAGVTSTSARRIACPVTGNVKLAVGSQYFYNTNWEILIFNTKFAITKVTATFSGSTYTLGRQTYNYWLYNGPAVAWPITIAVTDVNGAVVTFPAMTFKSGLIADAGGQFPSPLAALTALAQCSQPLTVNSDGWIYTDALTMQYTDINYINVFSWLDWSYSSTVNWASCTTTAPYSGTNCVSATIGTYGAIQIGRSYNFAWSGLFSSLQFAIKADVNYNGLTVGFKTGGSAAIPVTTSWKLWTLDLASDISAPAIVGGTVVPISFYNTKSSTTPTIYLDSIRLIPVTGSSTTTAAPTPTTSAPTTSTPTTTRAASTSAPTTTTPTTTTTTKATTTTTTATPIKSTTTQPPPISGATTKPTVAATTTAAAPIVTVTTTVAPTTAAAAGAAASGCTITLTQTFIRSWTSGGLTFSQWNVLTANPSSNLASAVTITTTSPAQISQLWTAMYVSMGVYGLPSYLVGKGLAAGGSFEWGYIASQADSLPWTVTGQC